MYQRETFGLIDFTLTYQTQVKCLTVETRDVNDLGPAKFRMKADNSQEQICCYNRNKRATSFNSFLEVRKQTAFSVITFFIVKLINKTNKNANIYFEINDEPSDFSNDSNKRTVQRISEGNITRETTAKTEKGNNKDSLQAEVMDKSRKNPNFSQDNKSIVEKTE